MVLSASKCGVLAIDMQTNLAPALSGAEDSVLRARLVLRAAAMLGVPVVVTEQYPNGLGRTLPDVVRELVPPTIVEKLSFDAWAEPEVRERVDEMRREVTVVLGMEAHVCVLQTVLGLLNAGRSVAVVADAVASRRDDSRVRALERAARHGAEIVDSEMVVFEWLSRSDSEAFRTALPWIKDPRTLDAPVAGAAGNRAGKAETIS